MEFITSPVQLRNIIICVKLNICHWATHLVSLDWKQLLCSWDLQHATSLALGLFPVSNEKRYVADPFDPRAFPPSEKLTRGQRPHRKLIINTAALQSRISPSITALICKQMAYLNCLLVSIFPNVTLYEFNYHMWQNHHVYSNSQSLKPAHRFKKIRPDIFHRTTCFTNKYF